MHYQHTMFDVVCLFHFYVFKWQGQALLVHRKLALSWACRKWTPVENVILQIYCQLVYFSHSFFLLMFIFIFYNFVSSLPSTCQCWISSLNYCEHVLHISEKHIWLRSCIQNISLRLEINLNPGFVCVNMLSQELSC